MIYGYDRSPLSCSMITKCTGKKDSYGCRFFHFFPFSSLWVSRCRWCCLPSVAAEVKQSLWYGAGEKSIRLLSSWVVCCWACEGKWRKEKGDLQFLRDTGDLRDFRVRSFSNAIRAGTISCLCILSSSGEEKRENLRNKPTECKGAEKMASVYIMSMFGEGICAGHHSCRSFLQLSQFLPSLIQRYPCTGQVSNNPGRCTLHALHVSWAWNVLGQATGGFPCSRFTNYQKRNPWNVLATASILLTNILGDYTMCNRQIR